MTAVLESVEKEVPLDQMPLETYEDYKKYNAKARLENKRARKQVYPPKPCPLELHPKTRIVFNRKDQPSNPLPVFLCNDMIDFQETLIPGKTYELPNMVVKFLQERGTYIYERVDNPDGSYDTKPKQKIPRFNINADFGDLDG